MSFELYQDVVLVRDIPSESLCQGDVATIVDRVSTAGGEEGYVLEIFNSLGQTLRVVVVPSSAIKPPSADEVWAVRPLARAP